MTAQRTEQVNVIEEIVDPSQRNTAKVILGKSLPRSGHHFFIRLLAACLKADFHYCEIYTNPDCCQSQPCKYEYPGLLFFQKSHDFQLNDEIPESCKFLIQYRHPIPRLFSDWNLAVSTRDKLVDSYESFVKFSRNRKKYYIDFFKKWVIPFTDDDHFFMMSYECLTGETFETIQRFLRFAIDENYKVDRIALSESNMSVNSPNSLQSHKYYNKEFLQDYQLSIIEEIPELPYLPLKL